MHNLPTAILADQIAESIQAVRSLDCDRALLKACQAEAKRLASHSDLEIQAASKDYTQAVAWALQVTPVKRYRIR